METELNTGGGYSSVGTTQLLSVPYALYAKTAETIAGGITETDPVFSASTASGISGTDITYWNNKGTIYPMGPWVMFWFGMDRIGFRTIIL